MWDLYNTALPGRSHTSGVSGAGFGQHPSFGPGVATTEPGMAGMGAGEVTDRGAGCLPRPGWRDG